MPILKLDFKERSILFVQLAQNCHCQDIGVGLSDKWQPCGCGVCECDKEQIKYPDWS